MGTLTRIAKNPMGMARLVTNYSRIKEMQAKDLTLLDISDIFDEDFSGLSKFVEFADGFVSGSKNLSLDVAVDSKAAFKKVASALK